MTLRTILSIPVAVAVVVAAATPTLAGLSADQQAHQGMSHPAAASSDVPPELQKQLDALRDATRRFRDHTVAVAEGYTLFGGDGPLMGEHWVRRDLVDRPFDIASPSTLQYLEVNGERVLTGVAYTVYRAPDEPLPGGFSGEADEWHVHNLISISMAATEGRPLLRWLTNRRIENGRTQWTRERPELTMVHAWAWLDNPDGVFAQDHRAIPYLRASLSPAWALGASVDAAYGVALLGPDACGQEVKKTNFLAGATWRQRRDLTRACESAQSSVRAAAAALPVDSAQQDHAGHTLNAAAEHAWKGYLDRRGQILTPEQTARLAVGIEHPDHHGGGS